MQCAVPTHETVDERRPRERNVSRKRAPALAASGNEFLRDGMGTAPAPRRGSEPPRAAFKSETDDLRTPKNGVAPAASGALAAIGTAPVMAESESTEVRLKKVDTDALEADSSGANTEFANAMLTAGVAPTMGATIAALAQRAEDGATRGVLLKLPNLLVLNDSMPSAPL